MASVYVASPYGFSEATKAFYEQQVLAALYSAGIEPLDPWDDPLAQREQSAAMELQADERREALGAMNRRLGAANAQNIERADAVLAVLDGVDVDSGTAAEVGYAAALGKPVVGVRFDTRQAGDNEAAVINMQVEHFIVMSGGDIVRSMEEAMALLALLLGQPPLPGAPHERTRPV